MKHPLLRCADLLILLFLLLVSLCLFLVLREREAATVATVCYGREVLDTVDLSALEEPMEKSYSSDGGEVRVLFERDGVRVVSSACTGKDCVKTGKASRAGEGIVCLPLRFSVTLSGESELDGITG